MTIMDSPPQAELDAGTLLKIIRCQTEIIELGTNLEAVMAQAAHSACELTHAAGAVIEMKEDDDMVYRAATGSAKHQLGLRLALNDSLSGACIAAGKPLQCDDAETDPRVNREACRKVGLRSMIVTPLRHQQSIVGVLKVFSPDSHAFGPADLRVIELISEAIGASIYLSARTEASELFHLATHDVLTGLANRALFFDRLRIRLAQGLRQGDVFGVLILDIDNMKTINDQYGHRTGDAAICEFAKRISIHARESDTVARTGGDEFAILLHELEHQLDAETACRRLASQLGVPFDFEHKTVPLAASVGLAVFPHDGDDMEQLIERADQNMYRQKRSRKRGEATPPTA